MSYVVIGGIPQRLFPEINITGFQRKCSRGAPFKEMTDKAELHVDRPGKRLFLKFVLRRNQFQCVDPEPRPSASTFNPAALKN